MFLSKEFKPLRRKNDLVVQELENELLIYDLNINKAFCLNQISTNIYNLCDGTNEVSVIAEKTSLPKEVIEVAIADLSKQNLLTEQIKLHTSRRNLLKSAALTAMALPIISTVAVPVSAQALSVVCNGTAPGGFFIGMFPSGTGPGQGLNACTTPACATCLSMTYSPATSSCDNAECTTVSCFCAPV